NYFESGLNNIDTIICEEPITRFEDVNYSIVTNNLFTKIKRKLIKNPHQVYIDTLMASIKPNEKYIVQVVDNFGFVKALFEYLNTNPAMRKQFYIQFFYHGYPPFY